MLSSEIEPIQLPGGDSKCYHLFEVVGEQAKCISCPANLTAPFPSGSVRVGKFISWPQGQAYQYEGG